MLCCDAGASTVVTTVAELFEVSLSTLAVVAAAVFVIEPILVAVATIVTVAEPLPAIEPRLQVTVPAEKLQLPWLGVAETYAIPAGNMSVTIVPAADAPPLFVTE